MSKEEKISPEEAVKLLVESYGRMAKHAHDIAYARRTMYEAYLSEGFNPMEALELCKIL
jgi:hypothetical protein